jgi:hypothetical protein
MKINWKALAAVVIIIGAAYSVFSMLHTNNYSGSNLTFSVGSGSISITNPSTETLPVQLIGTSSVIFSVVSENDDVSGRSTRQGTGRTSTQLYEFGLPPGVTKFTVERNAGVSFVSTSDTRLEASVQENGVDQISTTLVIASIVILSALFYISHTYEHAWIDRLSGKKTYDEEVKTPDETGGQGHAIKAYGDNRT